MRTENKNRRHEILDIVRTNPGCTSSLVAKTVGIPQSQASNRLSGYVNKGYLSRKREAGGFRYYFKLAAAANPVIEKPQIIKPAYNSTLGSVLNSVVQDIATSLAEQILANLEPILAERLEMFSSTVVSRAMRTQPKLAQVENNKKKSVCVVGLWNSQKSDIKREFEGCLDIRFIGPDENIQKLKAAAERVDSVIVMTSKVSHKHTEAIECIRTGYTNVRGGLTSLRAELTALYVGN